MSLKNNNIVQINSIDALHKAMGFQKPKHPLFSVHRYENVKQIFLDEEIKLVTDLYQITLKRITQMKH